MGHSQQGSSGQLPSDRVGYILKKEAGCRVASIIFRTEEPVIFIGI
jgi:hypothetical protein